MTRVPLPFAVSVLVLASPLSLARHGGFAETPPMPAAATAAGSVTFQPPPESVIPSGPLGQAIRQGEEIFRHTGRTVPQFVGNDLSCGNCHIDGGRLANASPLWAAWVAFPAYRTKNGHVNTFAERLQECFQYSMNGKKPPLGDPALVALEAYSAWLARGAPTGMELAGRGYPRLPKPAAPPSFARGKQVYDQHCALCHGTTGAGASAGGQVVFPPLWGARSYNWGAGMTTIVNAAGFIKANMPLGIAGSLTDQQAWDVATYIDSQDRPQDPRFTGSVQETRAKFHDSPYSMYGLTVNGHLLGGTAPERE
jgi:thiosulfate dehydrogenase